MPHPLILYVEDEETDVLLLKIACERARLPNPIASAADGAEAIDYLAGNGRFADRGRHPVPALVLLDLNLPGQSGFHVLAWARQQEQLASLPMVVYTSSDRESDRRHACDLGATDYMVKPTDVRQMTEVARRLSQRWLNGKNQD